jgi:hypothetical protein
MHVSVFGLTTREAMRPQWVNATPPLGKDLCQVVLHREVELAGFPGFDSAYPKLVLNSTDAWRSWKGIPESLDAMFFR